MSINRREYLHSMFVNGIEITKIIIDPHYELKHSEVINDELIIKLVETLEGNFYEFIDEKDNFMYFVTNEILIDNKKYKLIWLMEKNKKYIGVINAFRSSK